MHERFGIRAAPFCLVAAMAVAANFGDTIPMVSPKLSDWPTYQHDNRRSGVTSESLPFPLAETWRYTPRHAPAPAWPDEARFDLAHSAQALSPRLTFDRAFHVAAAKGRLFFASSADDQVRALDAATGAVVWSFFAQAPLRLAPAFWDDKVYFGSDDGCVYCVDAADGGLVWQYAPCPNSRWIPGNGRLISACAVRTGVAIEDGIAYFGAGLFPSEGVYLCAVDARTGTEVWKRSPDAEEFISRFVADRSARRYAFSPQGYLLASRDRLYIPNGRTAPTLADRASGEILGVIACQPGDGGTYALLADDRLITGPGTGLREFELAAQDPVASFAGRCIVVDGAAAYLLSDTALAGLDRARYDDVARVRAEIMQRKRAVETRLKEIQNKRAELSADEQRQADAEGEALEAQRLTIKRELEETEGREFLWTSPCGESFAMILAAQTLLVGSDGKVSAYAAASGEKTWEGEVAGKAYGVAVADGRLYVSTDSGVIHCFSAAQGKSAEPRNESGGDRAGLTPDVEREANEALGALEARRGYCLVLGCTDGSLAGAIARNSEFRVVAVDDDPARAAAVRANLDRAGLYGSRVSVYCGPLEHLPVTDFVANLVVSERRLGARELETPAREMLRITRPCGGVVWIALEPEAIEEDAFARWAGAQESWELSQGDPPHAVFRRGPLPGAGKWPQRYGGPGNEASSGDALVRGPMQLQWFGLPGPAVMADRHHRPNPPLAADGRLFVTADNRLIAMDVYNGSLLWDTETPGSRRLAAQRDAGQMAAADDWLYAAVGDVCWALDAATGEKVRTFSLPERKDKAPMRWGYTATIGDALLGSGQKAEASYTKISTLADYEIQWGDFKRMIVSNYLFCLDRHTGQRRWTYRKGVIAHPTIAADERRVYFLESRNPQAIAEPTGRVTLDVLLAKDARVTALELDTGKTAWEIQPDLSSVQHILYLSCSGGIVLAVGSGNRGDRAWYFLYAFDAATGAPLWKAEHPNNKSGINGDHGEQVHHPVIIGDIVIAEPAAYNLRTGKRIDPTLGADGTSPGGEKWELAPREGCGTISGAAHSMFYRDGFPCTHDLSPGGQRQPLDYVSRTGCWINMVADDGVLLVPEGSSGCSCPHPLQISMAYIPKP